MQRVLGRQENVYLKDCALSRTKDSSVLLHSRPSTHNNYIHFKNQKVVFKGKYHKDVINVETEILNCTFPFGIYYYP